MNFDFLSWMGSARRMNGTVTHLGVFDPNKTFGDKVTPSNSSIVYTCSKLLAENVSRMPLGVYKREGKFRQSLKEHRLSELLLNPNSYQNTVTFISTMEYNRCYYGNAFAEIVRKGNSGHVKELKLIHPLDVESIELKGSSLYYNVRSDDTNKSKTIKGDNIIHVMAVSDDGIIGYAPVMAAKKSMNIHYRASQTVEDYYVNNASGQYALESSTPSAAVVKAMQEAAKTLKIDYTGGKVTTLPPNTKLVTLSGKFTDAELVNTLNFTRKEIAALYGIPGYMIGDSSDVKDIEQYSLHFRNFTIAPIVRAYRAEFERKLLTTEERKNGLTIEFDSSTLIEMDEKTKVENVKTQVTNGLMTLNEGAIRLGNDPINAKHGDYHFAQAQYIPIEQYEKYNPLLKNDPAMKGEKDNANNGKKDEQQIDSTK